VKQEESMRHWYTIAASVLALATPCGARETRVGATADYAEVLCSYRRDGADVIDHYDTIGASGVLDFEHVRLVAGVANNFGNFIVFTDGRERQDDGFHITYLDATVLGKLPFYFADRRLALWPALGLRSAYALRYRYDGSQGREPNRSPHDWLVVGGIGLDYDLSRRFVFTSVLTASCNLTPSPGADAQSPLGFEAGLSLGVLGRL
jgi:hypothetical protein